MCSIRRKLPGVNQNFLNIFGIETSEKKQPLFKKLRLLNQIQISRWEMRDLSSTHEGRSPDGKRLIVPAKLCRLNFGLGTFNPRILFPLYFVPAHFHRIHIGRIHFVPMVYCSPGILNKLHFVLPGIYGGPITSIRIISPSIKTNGGRI